MIEIFRPEWAHVATYVQTRIDELRVKLESVNLTNDQTMAYRGEIRALKKLLDLPADLAAARNAQTPPPAWPADGSS